jgi:antibiotic biosynthesis monooxygenase (ABM) superfamily enzyme
LNVEPEIEQEFQSWIASHGKSYGTQEEYKMRLAIFARKYNVVLKHNSENTDDH